jgi:tRNA1(Val) A37 N6-methylase TrmN6
MAAPAFAYDRVAYPALVFSQTHPERLAVLARLAGLDPPDPARARILDIGGGDGLNLLAVAAAYPGCDAHGFDLSSAAIARGQAMADSGGFANVTLAVENILEAHRRYPARSCDYVTAHGVYAWVPPEVRRALMAFIGHVLSDRGVAHVSYNCMPGGHLRMILREMLLDAIEDIDDPGEKVARTRAMLEDYGRPRDGDPPLVAAVRGQARSRLDRPDALLFHDELGECYFPQRFRDVVRAGEAHGLRFLTDAARHRVLDGFFADAPPEPAGAPPEPAGDAEEALLRAVSHGDYQAMRFFRHTLFVRAEQHPDRRIDPDRIRPLHLSTGMKRRADGAFEHRGATIALKDEALARGLERAAAGHPRRQRVADVAPGAPQMLALLQLFAQSDVNLHVAPLPFLTRPGPRPRSSPLVRAMIAAGEPQLCTLEGGLMRIEHGPTRALLAAADGTRTMAEIAAAGHGIPPREVEAALTAAALRGLMAA